MYVVEYRAQDTSVWTRMSLTLEASPQPYSIPGESASAVSSNLHSAHSEGYCSWVLYECVC